MRDYSAAFSASLRMFSVFAILLLLVGGCGPKEEVTDGSDMPPGTVLMPDGTYQYPRESAGYDRESVDNASDDDYDDADDDTASDADDSGSGDAYGYSDSDTANAYGAPDEGVEPPANRPGYDDPYASQGRGAAEGQGYDDGYNADAYAASTRGDSDSAGEGVYEEQIAPILRARCYNCHGGGPRGRKGDLELHTPDAIQSHSGLVVAFEPDDSELYYRITLDEGDDNRMPPKGPSLTTAEVGLIKSWIESGARFTGGSGDDPYGDAYASGRQSDGADDDNRGRRPPPAPPKNLAEAASVAFQRGNDPEAMNHLYAQTLLKSDPATAQVLSNYRFVPALKRTKLAVRWGVGIDYRPSAGWEGSVRPIGVVQDLPGDDDDDRNGSDNDDDAIVEFSNEQLDYYTGDWGKELLLRLQFRMERSYYGEVLKQEIEKHMAGSDEDEFDNDGGYGDAYARQSPSSGYGYGGTGRGDRGGSSSEKPKNQIEQIMPGVTMLGEHSKSKLFADAKKQGLDLLVIFEVQVEPNRIHRFVRNKTRVRLYNVATSKAIASTSSLVNVDVQRERAEDDEYEPIIDETDKIFAVADGSYKCKTFPDKATAKHAKDFARALLQVPSENPLWKLSEIRFYESRGLLTEKEVAAVFKKIVPKHASSLADVSDESQVREMFASLLVMEEPESDDDDDSDDEEDDDERERKRPTFR